jgi:GNAT superfamily N-acetyltransferase
MRVTPFSELSFHQWEPMWLDYAGRRRSELTSELNLATFSRLKHEGQGTGVLQGMALWQDELIGFAHFFLHPSTWSTTQECYLQDIYVVPSHRGTGAGKYLLLEVAQKAKQLNCTIVHWRTRSENLNAQALYDKLARRLDYVEYQIELT